MSRSFVLLAWLAASSSTSTAQTLAEVLKEHAISIGSSPVENFGNRITSFAVLDDATNFMIAYYIDDSSGRLRPPLFVARYAKQARKWDTAALSDAKAPWRGSQVACLGSALAIRQVVGFLFIDTHISPSAGCVLVLSKDLRFKKALYGWYLASFTSGSRLGDD